MHLVQLVQNNLFDGISKTRINFMHITFLHFLSFLRFLTLLILNVILALRPIELEVVPDQIEHIDSRTEKPEPLYPTTGELLIHFLLFYFSSTLGTFSFIYLRRNIIFKSLPAQLHNELANFLYLNK